MPGRHASPDPSRFRRDLTRLVILALVTGVVVASVLLIIRLLAGGGEEPDEVPSAAESSDVSGPTSTAATVTSTTPSTTTTTTTMGTTTLPPVRDPGEVIVVVLNSTQVAGLAGRVTEQLSDLGYLTLEPDNHPTSLETSVIWYVEDFEREAEALAEEIADANVEPFPGDDPEAALTVVLGASYRG